jgi:small subunit ribosomal protein S1
MSEPTSPDQQPTTPPGGTPPVPPVPGPGQPPRVPGPRQEGGPRRPFPRGDRPKNDGSKPPQMDITKDFSLSKPNTRALDQSIEAEMEAALAGFDVSGSVAKEESGPRTPTIPGQQQPRKRGIVLAIHGKDVFIDVPGGRSQGVMPMLQFEGKPPVVGQEIEFDIEGYDGANGLLKLTMQGAVQSVSDWSSITRGMVVEAKVTGVNKNRTGLMIEVNGIKGFMPISQIDMYRVEKPEDYINQRLKCMVSELEPAERNLVVSRRALLERERMQKLEEFWATVEEGQVLTGIVRSVKPFGAFVDLGAADGLIPISELSWSRVSKPEDLVQIGQKVEVKVHRLDHEARKIALSLKQLLRSPWDDFVQQFRPGSRVNGKVTRILEFGAFVELIPGIEGLIHITEMATLRVRRVRDIVAEGQDVTVQILAIDNENHRIALSLKALAMEAEDAESAAADAEKQDDMKTAEERLASRPVNPNLRGGIGRGGALFGTGE